ncbi:MAG: aldehyde ferredoxin oxidoreductase C-terminal domain-containing protein [Bacillota bacterium]
MTIPGYAGRILYLDLSGGKTRIEETPPEMIDSFLGGSGINTRLAADLISPAVDPFSPENPIIVGAGPFAGTVVPGGAKVFISTRLPAGNAFARCSGGGAFALMMKSCGFDHIVITGKSPTPVYIKIVQGAVELCDASGLRGCDIYETVDRLKELHGPCSIIPIGVSGERLVKISITSVDKGGTIGRGGLPAVMGSKNIKALVACMGNTGVEVARHAEFTGIINGLIKRMKSWPGRDILLENGMSLQFLAWWGTGHVLAANGTKVVSPSPEKLAASDRFAGLYRANRRPLACPGCPMADKEVVTAGEGTYSGTVCYGNNIHTLPAAEADFGKWVRLTELVNREGLDWFDFQNLMSLCHFLYRRGILTGDDLGGAVIDEGSPESYMELVRLTATRQGFGDVLAEGLPGMQKRLGREAGGYVTHIKGHSPVFDPRANYLGTMEFTQMTNPRGAHVAFGGSPTYTPGKTIGDFEKHGRRMGIPQEAMARVITGETFSLGRFSRYSEDWCSLFDCLSLCNRAFINRFYGIETITGLFNAITGLEKTAEDLMLAAERSWNLWRIINGRLGFSRQDDRPPEMWFFPVRAGDKELTVKDYFGAEELSPGRVDLFLDDYYAERGWDTATGLPSLEKKKKLGLEGF